MTKEEIKNKLNSLKDYYNDKNEDSYVGFDDEDNKALDMAIKALEQTRWIPVSEKLPEEGEDVLVCVKGYDSCGHYEDQLWRAPDGSLHISGECKHGECDECKWNLATHFFYCEVAAHYNESPSSFPDGWSIIDEGDEVIAWMPLPKPYKAESEEI